MPKTRTVGLYEAKTHLSKLVEEASAGAEITITKSGKAKARLVPLEQPKRGRQPGGWTSGLWVADDFDEDLPPDVLAGFLGEDEDGS